VHDSPTPHRQRGVAPLVSHHSPAAQQKSPQQERPPSQRGQGVSAHEHDTTALPSALPSPPAPPSPDAPPPADPLAPPAASAPFEDELHERPTPRATATTDANTPARARLISGIFTRDSVVRQATADGVNNDRGSVRQHSGRTRAVFQVRARHVS
jgi:hypothetical protein